MLTGGPINSPSRVSSTPSHSSQATVGHARISYYSLHTIQNTLLPFFLRCCFHFIYSQCSFFDACVNPAVWSIFSRQSPLHSWNLIFSLLSLSAVLLDLISAECRR